MTVNENATTTTTNVADVMMHAVVTGWFFTEHFDRFQFRYMFES